MDLLRSGGNRGIRKAGAVFAAMVVFQVLAVVGAGNASAFNSLTGCQYNVGNDTVTVNLEPNDDIDIYVFDPGQQIRVFDNNGAVDVDCGSATTSNTVQINVLGTDAGDEVVTVDDQVDGTFAGINFAIDLGTSGAVEADVFVYNGSDNADEVTLSASQQNQAGTLNGGTFELVGAEEQDYNLNDGDDTFDGDGSTARTFIDAGAGADTVMPGLGPDDVYGGDNPGDTVSYEARTGNVSVSLNDAVSDADDGVNCTDDVTFFNTPSQGICEGDDVYGFEVVMTGSGNDYLEGDEFFASDEILIPGEGDDETVGNGGNDTTAWSNCTGPVTIDVATATTTGCGTDTWDTEMVAGSPASNGETIPNRVPATGPVGNGDWLDFSGVGGGVTVDLTGDALVNGDWDLIENVLGTEGDDLLIGNQNGNILNGAGGDDSVNGQGGNDMLIGGQGNDAFTGGGGADAVYFGLSGEGVTVDLSLGFATGEGSDTFLPLFGGVDVEIVFGSNFNDDITGGLTGFGSGINFRFVGKAGNDLLTGADSNDRLLGGGGNDVMRGGAGLDVLKGAKGEDWGYGGGGRDLCTRSTEHVRSC